MTTLVAVTVSNGVWIGADSAITDSGDRRCRELEPFAKWDFLDGWALGLSGCPLTAQAATTALSEIKRWLQQDATFEKLLMARCTLLRAYTDYNVPVKEGHYKASGMLVGDGKVWDIGSSGVFLPGTPGKLFASGSGADFALGAWQVQEQLTECDSYFGKLTCCLEAARHYDIYTGSELWVKFLDRDGKFV